MNDVVKFKSRPQLSEYGVPIITKIVNGKPVRLVNVDEMSSLQRERYFNDAEKGKVK